MSKYDELVKALRYCVNARNCQKCAYRINNNSVKCRIQRVEDAAAAIEALQARLGEAENSVERWKDMYLTKHEEVWMDVVGYEGLYQVSDQARVRNSKGQILKQFVNFDEHGDGVITGELVRCRACRWGHLCVMGQHLGLDGFCSKGEREVQE